MCKGLSELDRLEDEVERLRGCMPLSLSHATANLIGIIVQRERLLELRIEKLEQGTDTTDSAKHAGRRG